MATSFRMAVTPSKVAIFPYVLSKRLEAAQNKAIWGLQGEEGAQRCSQSLSHPGVLGTPKNTSQPLLK